MAAKTYNASNACAWGLTMSGATFGVAGVLALFIPDASALNFLCVVALAGMTAFAVACANFAAAAAMHAVSGASRVHWPTFWPSLALTLIFAIGSAGGVHLGWIVLADMAPDPAKLPPAHVVDLAALVLCVAKPAMTWIIEGRRAIDLIAAREADERAEEGRRIEAAAERDRLAAQERIARAAPIAPPSVTPPPSPVVVPIRRPKPAPTSAKPQPKGTNDLRGLAAAGLVIFGGLGPQGSAVISKLTDGQSVRSVERETGLPYHHVRKIKAAVEAGLIPA